MADANFLRNAPEMIEDDQRFIDSILLEEASVFGEKKRCEWMKKGHSGHCGKKCKDGPFCDEHLQKIAAGRSLRFPCIGCLAAIKDSVVCGSCRIVEQEVTEFEKDNASVGTYWWHYKKQQSGN